MKVKFLPKAILPREIWKANHESQSIYYNIIVFIISIYIYIYVCIGI